jgi:hypothetical protein
LWSLHTHKNTHTNHHKEGNGDGGKSNGVGNEDARMKAARGIITATKKARVRVRAARWMATAIKRAKVMAARGMTTATRVVGNKKGNGNGNKEDDGVRQQHHGQWPWQRGWRAFDGGNNGNGDGDGTKDMAACATTGERGMMVATGHGLCVCFCVWRETTKNTEESKIVHVPESL